MVVNEINILFCSLESDIDVANTLVSLKRAAACEYSNHRAKNIN